MQQVPTQTRPFTSDEQRGLDEALRRLAEREPARTRAARLARRHALLLLGLLLWALARGGLDHSAHLVAAAVLAFLLGYSIRSNNAGDPAGPSEPRRSRPVAAESTEATHSTVGAAPAGTGVLTQPGRAAA